MDEIQEGLNKVVDELNYWKDKYYREKQRRMEQHQAMEKELTEAKGENHQMKNNLEILREQLRRLQQELANKERIENELRAQIQNLEQRGNSPNNNPVVSPARSTSSSSSGSTLSACSCPPGTRLVKCPFCDEICTL